MMKREELANLMNLEDLLTHQLAAIRQHILYALADATPEDIKSVRRIELARGIEACGAPVT